MFLNLTHRDTTRLFTLKHPVLFYCICIHQKAWNTKYPSYQWPPNCTIWLWKSKKSRHIHDFRVGIFHLLFLAHIVPVSWSLSDCLLDICLFSDSSSKQKPLSRAWQFRIYNRKTFAWKLSLLGRSKWCKMWASRSRCS